MPAYSVLVAQNGTRHGGVLEFLRLVLDGDRLAQVPDKVIAELKGRERNGLGELPLPPDFKHGDTVRITRGVFTGQLALLEGQRPRERVAVLLQLLGRVRVAEG